MPWTGEPGTGDPARNRVLVGLVFHAEPGAQFRFFVPDNEQVKCRCQCHGVEQKASREVQPCLPRDDEQGGDVDRVAHPAVGPGDDEPARRVPVPRCSPADRREEPDTPQVQNNADGDDRDGVLSGRCRKAAITGEDQPRHVHSARAGHKDCEQGIAEEEAERPGHLLILRWQGEPRSRRLKPESRSRRTGNTPWAAPRQPRHAEAGSLSPAAHPFRSRRSEPRVASADDQHRPVSYVDHLVRGAAEHQPGDVAPAS